MITNDHIFIRMKDWTFTSGLVGMYRLYRFACEHDLVNGEEVCEIQKTGLKINSAFLEQLPSWYFKNLIFRFDYYEIRKTRMERYMKNASYQDQFEDNLKYIKHHIKSYIINNIKKISLLLGEEQTATIKNLFNKIEKIKKYDEFDTLVQYINEYIEWYSLPTVKKALALHNGKRNLSRFYGQTSFLNTSFKGSSLEDYIQSLFKDYIQNILFDLKIQNTNEREELLKWYDENNEIKKVKPLKKYIDIVKKAKKVDIASIRKKHFINCPYINGAIAYEEYNGDFYRPIKLSLVNINFSWNGVADRISNLAKLVLFCSIFGMTEHHQVIKVETEFINNKEEMFFAFLMSDGDFSEILNRNNRFNEKIKKQAFYNEALQYALNTENSDINLITEKFDENVFLVNFHTSDNAKLNWSYMNFLDIPSYLIKYFQDEKKRTDAKNRTPLQLLKPYQHTFTRYLIENKDTLPLIHEMLRLLITPNEKYITNYIAINAIIERNRVLCFKKQKGDAELNKTQKLVWQAYQEGKNLRLNYYQGDNANKLTNLAYKLLNASKGRNKSMFMDTLFRVYIPTQQPMNQLFLNIIDEKDIDFDSIANAFITGLLYERKEKSKEENKA